MAVLTTRVQAGDYAAWKPMFDQDPPGARATAAGHRVFRLVEDPDEVLIVVEFATTEEAGAARERLLGSAVLERVTVSAAPVVALEAEAVAYRPHSLRGRSANPSAPLVPGGNDRGAAYAARAMRTLAAGDPAVLDDDLLIAGDNLAAMATLPGGAFDMAYLDPPFNTGSEQRRGALHYADAFADYAGFLAPRLERVRELLAPHGTLYLHLDYREAHRCKLLLDELFGPECFLNELIWIYDYGGRPKRRWPAKHDTILVYVRDRARYHFDDDEVDREPYMAPGLVGPEKAARGKRPSDCWWHTIVPTNSREKTGYPTQKPAGIVRRMVAASSRPGGWCLDPFAGSGTLGAACRGLGRRFVLVDENPEAIAVATARLAAPPAGRCARS